MSQDLIFVAITVFVLVGFGFVLVRELKRFPKARIKAGKDAGATLQPTIAAASSIPEKNARVAVVTMKKEPDRPKPGNVRITGKHGRGEPREVALVGMDTRGGMPMALVKFPGDNPFKVHRRPLSQVLA